VFKDKHFIITDWSHLACNISFWGTFFNFKSLKVYNIVLHVLTRH
jgi:hypothetical protein